MAVRVLGAAPACHASVLQGVLTGSEHFHLMCLYTSEHAVRKAVPLPEGAPACPVECVLGREQFFDRMGMGTMMAFKIQSVEFKTKMSTGLTELTGNVHAGTVSTGLTKAIRDMAGQEH
eukprot:1157711-Pelagomonas_calceolata.AAC.12